MYSFNFIDSVYLIQHPLYDCIGGIWVVFFQPLRCNSYTVGDYRITYHRRTFPAVRFCKIWRWGGKIWFESISALYPWIQIPKVPLFQRCDMNCSHFSPTPPSRRWKPTEFVTKIGRQHLDNRRFTTVSFSGWRNDEGFINAIVVTTSQDLTVRWSKHHPDRGFDLLQPLSV